MQTLTNKFKVVPDVPPIPHIQVAENKYTDLLSKIQERAMKAACDYYPKVTHEMFGEVITDPYIDYHPPDSDLWIKLFLKCDDYELYARLFYIRGGGTTLIRDKYWGYKMQPVIGANGWESRNQYLIESACLNDYKDLIIGMLKDIVM